MGTTHRAERIIAAPVERVFAALVDRDAIAAWLPPADMTGAVDWFDARPGGGYRLTLSYRDPDARGGKTTAGSDEVAARFVDIVPNDRVVQAIDFTSDDPAFSDTMTMTWSVEAVDDGTRVSIRADDVPPGITEADHEVGLNSSLANLAAYVAG